MYWDEIKSLLLNYKKNNNNTTITHTIIPNKNNKIFNSGFALSIPVEDIDHVYDKLHDLYFNQEGKLSLTESFGELSPLIIDLDMKYEYKENKRFYTENTIIELIKFIYKQLNIYFDNIDSECWITEKEKPTYIKG